MFLIVGLGNPGTQYARTRHNAGWFVLDELARRHSIDIMRKGHDAIVGTGLFSGARVALVKPQTYMNLSGRAVSALLHYHRIERERLLIVTDDLNLPLGKLRMRPGGSDGGHNGLKSITQSLGSSEYSRLRLGVGEPPQEERRERGTAGHVLSSFSADEWIDVEAMTKRAADCVELWASEGTAAAMNRFNG
jgi:PTH1 family peptidyl-tRNA hydrolase